MRLVVFSREFPEYCFRYANAMARHCDVLLILDQRRTRMLFDIAAHEKNPRLTVHLERLDTMKTAPFALLRTLWRIALFRPDYVHLQEIPDRVAPVLAVLLRPLYKIIWTIHDPAPHSGRDTDLARKLALLQHSARRQATLIVVHGPHCRDDLLRACPWAAGRVVLSNHGILMKPVHEAPPPADNEILFFGRMEKYKGLEVLVQAAELLTARKVDFRLVIAGIGPELDRLSDRLARIPGIEIIPEYVSAKTASDLFARATIVVLPYLDASQSGVAAAAFGNNCPVIASRVGGLPDVIEHDQNGLLVEPGNAVELADALQKMLQDRDVLNRFRQAARATAEGKLSWDGIASDMAHQLGMHLEATQPQAQLSQR